MAFWDIYKGMGSGVAEGLWLLLYMIPIVIVIIIVISIIRNKIIYKYPVRIFRIRENNKVKEGNYKGGYIGRKNSAPFFRIKTGKMWWQHIDLTTTPNPKHFDEQDRVYYKQIDVNTFIQMKRVFMGDDKVTYTPVESDVKYGAILSVQRIKDILRTEPTWKKVLPYVGLVLMAIVFIVSYAMLMDKCGGA